MPSFARRTRTLRKVLAGLMARLGVPVGGRVRKLRAVKGAKRPLSCEKHASVEGV